MSLYAGGNWNRRKFNRAIAWLAFAFIGLMLVLFLGLAMTALYIAVFGTYGAAWYWIGHEDGHAQGLLDAKSELDEHEQGLS